MDLNPRGYQTSNSPVNCNGQQGISGHIKGHGLEVVDRGAQHRPMVPRELLRHVVVHQERAAHHRHDEVRDGQVGYEQVGEISQLLVARQGGDEYEVSQAADQHDADEHRADDDGGHEEGLALRGVRDLVGVDPVIHIVVLHVLVQLARLVLRFGDRVAGVSVAHVTARRCALWNREGKRSAGEKRRRQLFL